MNKLRKERKEAREELEMMHSVEVPEEECEEADARIVVVEDGAKKEEEWNIRMELLDAKGTVWKGWQKSRRFRGRKPKSGRSRRRKTER